MTKTSAQEISESRRLLENPYAYLDDLGFFSAQAKSGDSTCVADNKIAESRRKYQDPYAHLDEFGNFSAAQSIQVDTARSVHSEAIGKYSTLKETPAKKRYSSNDIEQKAVDLQRRMWQDRNHIWSGADSPNPIELLDPSSALRLVGYKYELSETLGQYFCDGKQVEIAGIIDDDSRQVQISRRFPQEVRNFTTAHELGHALLHDARGLHRDRPLDGTRISRESIEFEADKFASYFLMPGKLVKACFEKVFLTDRFSLNEETKFALSRGNSLDVERDCKTLRDLSRILASVGSYNGTRFASLASQFRVSTETMAIRLEELELLSI